MYDSNECWGFVKGNAGDEARGMNLDFDEMRQLWAVTAILSPWGYRFFCG